MQQRSLRVDPFGDETLVTDASSIPLRTLYDARPGGVHDLIDVAHDEMTCCMPERVDEFHFEYPFLASLPPQRASEWFYRYFTRSSFT